jgi:hypothetical protein
VYGDKCQVDTISLIASTASDRADHALQQFIGDFAAAFPGRVRAYYVHGSFADGTGLATSDLDLTVVFAGGFLDDGERQAAETLAKTCAAVGLIELDCATTCEDELRWGAHPAFKWASLCVFGEDVRDSIPVMPLAQWTRERMHAAYWLAVRLYGRGDVVCAPHTYPDPTAEFLGYDRRMLRLPDGREVRCTRDLIRSTGWAATALVAYLAGRYVVRKRDCQSLYRKLIGGPHADLLEDIYTVCRSRWRYLLPDDVDGRRHLRALCERTLAFENDFLAHYRRFVLAELTGEDGEAQRAALWMLGQIPLLDAEVLAAVRALEAAASVTVCEGAHVVLSKVNTSATSNCGSASGGEVLPSQSP